MSIVQSGLNDANTPPDPTATQGPRRADRRRTTAETNISLDLDLDGGRDGAKVAIDTGVPFFDHMLTALAKHGGLGLEVSAEGDLEIDAHHTVEDVGITLGQAFHEAVGDRAGLRRFGWATAVLDEARVTAALDLSGRPFLVYEIDPGRERIGDFDPQLLEEFVRAFVIDARVTLHLVQDAGANAHHVTEAAFKAFARALSDALTVDPRRGGGVPSTKGMLA